MPFAQALPLPVLHLTIMLKTQPPPPLQGLWRFYDEAATGRSFGFKKFLGHGSKLAFSCSSKGFLVAGAYHHLAAFPSSSSSTAYLCIQFSINSFHETYLIFPHFRPITPCGPLKPSLPLISVFLALVGPCQHGRTLRDHVDLCRQRPSWSLGMGPAES